MIYVTLLPGSSSSTWTTSSILSVTSNYLVVAGVLMSFNLTLLVIIIFPLSQCLTSPPTALTVKNVLSELKEVDWFALCGDGTVFEYGVLNFAPSQQRRIEKDFTTEDERRTAAISFFITNHPYASWRLLIHGLDREKKYSLSERLHPYAEKLTGMLDCSLYCH